MASELIDLRKAGFIAPVRREESMHQAWMQHFDGNIAMMATDDFNDAIVEYTGLAMFTLLVSNGTAELFWSN